MAAAARRDSTPAYHPEVCDPDNIPESPQGRVTDAITAIDDALARLELAWQHTNNRLQAVTDPYDIDAELEPKSEYEPLELVNILRSYHNRINTLTDHINTHRHHIAL